MRKPVSFLSLLFVLAILCSCGSARPDAPSGTDTGNGGTTAVPEIPSVTPTAAAYTADTKIADVIADPAFGNFGRLIFPVDNGYYSGKTLGDLRLTWYSHIDPAHTVAICNYFKEETQNGRQVFYDIYSEEEKAADPQKADTGLFFFRGDPGAKFAVTCAGGGFAYVGAMHDSFPHALELSRRGYNAFAVIYRPGAQTAYEDLARAISFIFPMPILSAWIRTAIPSGAGVPADAWRQRLLLTVWKPLAAAPGFRSQASR